MVRLYSYVCLSDGATFACVPLSDAAPAAPWH